MRMWKLSAADLARNSESIHLPTAGLTARRERRHMRRGRRRRQVLPLEGKTRRGGGALDQARLSHGSQRHEKLDSRPKVTSLR